MKYGGVRHACGQGDIYRPKQPAPFNPNMTSAESVPQPPSPLALTLKRKLEENLAKVRLQFQQQDPATSFDDFQEFDDIELQDGTTRLELNLAQPTWRQIAQTHHIRLPWSLTMAHSAAEGCPPSPPPPAAFQLGFDIP